MTCMQACGDRSDVSGAQVGEDHFPQVRSWVRLHGGLNAHYGAWQVAQVETAYCEVVGGRDVGRACLQDALELCCGAYMQGKAA